jgi:hypothetical protein
MINEKVFILLFYQKKRIEWIYIDTSEYYKIYYNKIIREFRIFLRSVVYEKNANEIYRQDTSSIENSYLPIDSLLQNMLRNNHGINLNKNIKLIMTFSLTSIIY